MNQEQIAATLAGHTYRETVMDCSCTVAETMTPEEHAAHQATVLAPAIRLTMFDVWAEGWSHYRRFFSPKFPEFGANPYKNELEETHHERV